MTRITYALVALLITAMLGCAVLAYLWIDRSITLSYTSQEVETSYDSMRHFEYLLQDEWRGMPEAQVLQKLQNAAARMPNAEIVIKKEEGAIWFDQVRFNIVHGQLNSVGRLVAENSEHP